MPRYTLYVDGILLYVVSQKSHTMIVFFLVFEVSYATVISDSGEMTV